MSDITPATWWPKLDPETRHWLQHHVGEALTEEILDAVVAAGGQPQGEFTPGKQKAPDRYDLTQTDWEWIAQQAHHH